MKKINFKKLTALLLSVIICTSFSMAGNTVSAAWYDFSAPETCIWFEDGKDSVATLYITDWADENDEDSIDTDLEAHTIAVVEDYGEYTIKIECYVDLTVTLSDLGLPISTYGYAVGDGTDVTIDAMADGNDCLNYSDFYSIAFFDSTHEIYRTYEDYVPLQGWQLVEDEKQGPTIIIGFTQ